MVQMTRGQELAGQVCPTAKRKSLRLATKRFGPRSPASIRRSPRYFRPRRRAFNTELDKLPPTTSAQAREDSSSKRQDLRGRVAQLKFLSAQTRFESAETYPPEADEFSKLHATAAEELSAVYDEFGRTMLVGLYARLYEGRCYQAVGNFALALGCYDELMGKDNLLGPFRKLAAAAMQRKAEVLIAQDKLDAAIAACNSLLKDAHKDEEKQAEWVGVRYRLAEALSKKATKQRPVRPSNTNSKPRPASRIEPLRNFLASSRPWPAPPQTPVDSTAPAHTAAYSKSEKDEPHTFQAAYDAGKEAPRLLQLCKTRRSQRRAQQSRLRVPELKSQMDRGKDDARHYFQIATSLVGPRHRCEASQ